MLSAAAHSTHELYVAVSREGGRTGEQGGRREREMARVRRSGAQIGILPTNSCAASTAELNAHHTQTNVRETASTHILSRTPVNVVAKSAYLYCKRDPLT